MNSRKRGVLLVACVLSLLTPSGVGRADELLEKSDVYAAGEGGYESYRIPALLVTPKGSLLAVCEARHDVGGDWGEIDILLKRSTDGGKSWTTARRIADVKGPHKKNPLALKQKLGKTDLVTQNNPLLIADSKTGAIHLLFCHEYLRCFYRKSDDDGRSFSDPVEITAAFEPFRKHYDWQVLATGPGHGVQLDGGRLVVPVWLSTGTGGHAHRPSVATTLYSDDHGVTWKCGDIVANETDPLVDPSESEPIVLADGRVMLNIRSEAKTNRRAFAVSPDGATGWTRPAFDDALVEPICMASICRLSKESADGKNRILFSNPANLEVAKGKAGPGKKRDRKNLTVRMSYDEGKTWPVAKALEPGRSAYSDLGAAPDGTIYCFYERTGEGKDAGSTLTLARFNVEWLTDGKDKLVRTAAP